MHAPTRRLRRSKWILAAILPLATTALGLLPGGGAQSTAFAQPAPAAPAAAGEFVLAAAGDIADRCTSSSSDCVHPKTAALVDQMHPAAVLTLGDNQYDDAHYSDFKNYFDKTWGRFKSIMHPAPGNHETYDDPPMAGYKKYFGSKATPNGKLYYSWDMGNWHFIVLDSNEFVPEDFAALDEAPMANADSADLAADSAQVKWLKSDLANTSKGCVAVYYHHPRFSSGDHGDNKGIAPVWSTLVSNHVDLVLNGHDHDYERYVPQDASGKADARGPVQIVVGSGGKELYPLKAEHATTAKLLKTFGVLKLTMTDSTFSTQLIGLDGKPLDNSPTYTCH